MKKAETKKDEKQAKEMQEKMRTASFTFDDFLEQMGQVKEMGPLDELIGMIPGANKMKGMKNAQIDDKQIVQIEAIIQSMTKDRKSTRLNSSHVAISYAVFCLKKKTF